MTTFPSEGPRGSTTHPRRPATSARAANSSGGHLPGSPWGHPSVMTTFPSEGPRGTTTLPHRPATSARVANSSGVISQAPRGDIRLSHMHIEHTHPSEASEQPRTILINKRRPAGQSNHRTKHSPPGSHTRPATIAERPAGVPWRHPERTNVHVICHNTIRMFQWLPY